MEAKLHRSGYFKGWYFKCCTGEKTVAFIPAYHYSNNRRTASLQIITDHTAYHLPFESLEYSDEPLSVKIGNCDFGAKGIHLNFRDQHFKFEGSLLFRSLSPIRYNIMGPFALVPFMQCRHSVYSMTHEIDGQIIFNDQLFEFHHGTGYIEGDRGYSFPKRYIWTQCCFKNGSLLLSVADIPLLGIHFTGIIGVVFLNGKEYRIATYLGARVKRIEKNTVTVKQGNFEFTAMLLKNNAQPLLAPVNGNMCRTIHESASCKAYYCFSYKDEVLCEFVSDKAGFEFEYH